MKYIRTPQGVRKEYDPKKERKRAWARNNYRANRELKKEYSREYERTHKEEKGLYWQEYYKENKNDINVQKRAKRATPEGKAKRKAYNDKIRPREQEKRRVTNQRRKMAAFKAYGGCECKWCGDTEMLALSIDHINNDGQKHREDIRLGGRPRLDGKRSYKPCGGSAFYYWLERHNYPKELNLQVLCMSCQFIKRLNGGTLPANRKDLLRKPPACENGGGI